MEIQYVHGYVSEFAGGTTIQTYKDSQDSAHIQFSRDELKEIRDRDDMPGSNRYVKLVHSVADRINHPTVLVRSINFGNDLKTFQEVFDTRMKFIDGSSFPLQDYSQEVNALDGRGLHYNSRTVIDVRDVEVVQRPEFKLEDIVERTLPLVPEHVRAHYVQEFGNDADIYLHRDLGDQFAVWG